MGLGSNYGVVVNKQDSDIMEGEFKLEFAQSAGAVEYTHYFSAEG